MKLVKDTVLTVTSMIHQGLKIVRRVKGGEELDVLSIPEHVPTNLLRIKAKTSDGKVGYFTIYDAKWKTCYVETTP